MKQHNRWLALFLASALVFSPIAEAKRAGGGKNHGMTRQNTSQQQNYPSSTQRPVQQQPMQPTGQVPTQQKSGSNVGGMVAAGVAGAAVGAVAANALADDDKDSATTGADETKKAEEESSSFGWLFWVILAGLAFAAYRFFSSRKKMATANHAPYPSAPSPTNFGTPSPAPSQQPPFSQTNTGYSNSNNTNIFGQTVGGVGGQAASTAPYAGGVYTNSGNQLPDGTEPAAFLRIARQRFNHIQAMNSASNINEIRRYLTPDLYQSMYQDIMENQDHNVAEFSNLNAMVVDTATEHGQYIVSVRFTGTVSEDLNSLPQPFTEIWHFVKPVGSADDWLVAGIQQA